MNEYRKKLLEEIQNKKCPHCSSVNIGVDNWGIFYDERDWFYYCKDCDDTFTG